MAYVCNEAHLHLKRINSFDFLRKPILKLYTIKFTSKIHSMSFFTFNTQFRQSLLISFINIYSIVTRNLLYVPASSQVAC